MKKILWVSKNLPIQSQLTALKNVFGQDTQIVVDSEPFSGADEIASRMRVGKYDEMVLIAPLSVCKKMLELGIKPLYSQMRPAKEENCDVTTHGSRERVQGTVRYYQFVKFRRLESIDMKYSDLKSQLLTK